MGLISRVSSRTYRYKNMLRSTRRLLQESRKKAVQEAIKTHRPGEGIASMAKDTNTVFRVTSFELFAKPNLKVAVPGTLLFAGCFLYIAYMKMNAENAVKAGTHCVVYNEKGEQRMGLKKAG